MWWDVILNNLPLVLLLTLAVIICGADLIKAGREWKSVAQKRAEKKTQEALEEKELKDTLIELKTLTKSLSDKFDQQNLLTKERIDKLDEKIADLTESDMHDIKAWIVEKYHEFYINKGWIDAFSADTIDHRYMDYLKEGGNSYVEALINQLHSLPMDPNLSINNHRDD